MSRPEDAFQIALVDFLERNGLYVRHIKNQGKWSAHYARQLTHGPEKGRCGPGVLHRNHTAPNARDIHA